MTLRCSTSDLLKSREASRADYRLWRDGLTSWALTHRIDLVEQGLRAISRSVPLGSWTVFYRPSVGRGRGGSFGEFDAVIAAQSHVYLVESKWEAMLASGVEARAPHNEDKQICEACDLRVGKEAVVHEDPPLDGWEVSLEVASYVFGAQFPR